MIPKAKKVKVLIAEDMEINILMYKGILENYYDLIIAKNGREAVEKYLESEPDIIIMDILMPEENGIDAFNKIRLISKSVPIIALTVLNKKEEMNSIMEYGFNDYLVKPITSEKLLQTMEKYAAEIII